MLSDRLSIALESGAFTFPPSGTIAVVGPRASEDLSELPIDRVEVVTRHYPDFKNFQDRGFTVATDVEGPYSAAIVCLPRSKAEARDLIWRAVQVTDGPIAIDGQKTDGVDSILKDIRKRSVVGEAISKAHGKFLAFSGGDFDDWAPQPTAPLDGRFQTAPGVFSADKIDPGSKQLAEALPKVLKGHVVDLGAGWGYLSDAILDRDGVTRLDLVESDHAALQAAKKNISDPRAQFHWADARTFQPAARVDHVVSNPPFHQGRAADPGLGQAFIRAGASMLKPSGHLWLVANRHLPYKSTLQDAFQSVEILGQTASFKLYTAARPRSSRKG